jgi:hypothetical protein
VLCRLAIQVKGLRIELPRKRSYLLRVDLVCATREALCHVEVIEEEKFLPSGLVTVVHGDTSYDVSLLRHGRLGQIHGASVFLRSAQAGFEQRYARATDEEADRELN